MNLETLRQHAAIAELGHDTGYVVIRSGGEWLASFVSDDGLGLIYRHVTNHQTADKAFKWCVEHEKAVSNIIL